MAESIPIGFRFSPTDSEILAYLESLILIKDDDQNQLKKDIVYYNFIRWATLYAMKPCELFNGYDHEEEAGYGDDLYFLTPLKKKTQNGSRNGRTVKTALSSGEEETIGTWKFQTGPTNIIDYKTRKPLGVKRVATFVPKMTEDNEDQDAGTSSSSSSSSSKKRKNAPEEMQGISYIMHEYSLNPYDDQVYSLCRIRRKIDKKILIKKKMRRSSSPTTNITTSTLVQDDDQEERAARYDHHQQENNNICYNDGQQQQEAVLPPEGDVQIISDDDKGLANSTEDIVSNEEFLSRLEQDVAATTTGGDLLYYGNYDLYDHVDHQEVMNTAGVSEINNIHPHVQTSDDDKRSAQEIEEDLELPAEWRQGATAEELGFFNIEDLLRSCH